MISASLPELIAKAYEGACRADGMLAFTEATADYLGANQSAVAIWPIKEPDKLLPILSGIEEAPFLNLFTDRDRADSLFWNLARLPAGETISSNGDLQVEALLPQDMADLHVLGGVVHVNHSNRCAIVFFRNQDRSAFSHSEQESLQLLMGYLERAIDMNRQASGMFSDLCATRSILDQAPRGLLILGQLNQVTYSNPEARRLLELDDGLMLTGDKIHISNENAQQEFAVFLKQLRTTDSMQDRNQQQAISVPRDSDTPDFQMIIFALPFEPQLASMDETRALATIAIMDPTESVILPEDLLRAFFHLTPAEAALTQSLSQGISLSDSAHHLDISINTARSQLRSIFRKVGVNSQATLMQKITQSLKSNRMAG
jgi:DNA-binding CsgD family transcriptional regulator/PAS domain-containing protein